MRVSTIGLAWAAIMLCGSDGSQGQATPWSHGRLKASANGRFLQFEDGTPFFWLADTAWLLFGKLDRSETQTYLEDRRQKGFTVIQVMVLHEMFQKDVYGAAALLDDDPARPKVLSGEPDYWDHVDFVVDSAADKGLFLAMVPAWGGLVKAGRFNIETARAYAEFLADRYRGKPNIVWVNGGDIRGDVRPDIWRTFGETLHTRDPNHLMTFHPYGRTQSSTWFHDESWLDFNMFQSGHRRYDQRQPSDNPATWKGEDNWKYVLEDMAKKPPKPTLDGEPSYEGIPQGLHDSNEPNWQARDARRYAYWAVFAGACGHTYGDNAVMQMHTPDSGKGDYGVRNFWYKAIHDPGAGQMQHLKVLMLSRPYFERRYDPSLIAGQPGQRYDRLIATRGSSYAFVYTYTGRPFDIVLGKLTGNVLKAWWYDPRTGQAEPLDRFPNQGTRHFDPPGDTAEGNDWVLVLDDVSQPFPVPGVNPQQ
jgi:hypothetical protein